MSNDGGLIVDIILSIDANGNVLLEKWMRVLAPVQASVVALWLRKLLEPIYKASPLPLPLEKAELWVGKRQYLILIQVNLYNDKGFLMQRLIVFRTLGFRPVYLLFVFLSIYSN